MPERFDKFTGPARRALQLAQEEARPFHHTYIGAEHILAGLLRQKDDAANRLLAELGVEPSEVLSAIQSRLYGLQSPQAFQLFARIGKSRRRTLSARASEVIRLAVDEAGHLGHDHVGTEHLLLGLLREGTSEAAKMLAGLGVSLEAVRAQIEKVPHGDSEQPDTPEQPPAQDALAEDAPTRPSSQVGREAGSFAEAWVRLTGDARRVIGYAHQEAARFGHSYTAPEDILLGLLRDESSVTVGVLRQLGAEPDNIRPPIQEFALHGNHRVEGEAGLTPRANGVIELAAEEAGRLGQNQVGPEHLLLGLLREGQNEAARVLESLGVSLDKARAQVESVPMRNEQVQFGPAYIPSETSFGSGRPSDRFDKFTERSRKVLQLAQEEAHRFNHNFIGTEHILLGLVREGDGVAARVLNNLGIELDKVRSAVEFIIGRGDRMVMGEIGLTPRGKRVIELAIDEARRLNHHYIGTEHLLLGLVREGEGIAAGVLETLGVSLEKIRVQVIEVLTPSSGYSSTKDPSGGYSSGDYPPGGRTSRPSEPPGSILELADLAFEALDLNNSGIVPATEAAQADGEEMETGEEPEAAEVARVDFMARAESQANLGERIDRALKGERVEFDDPVRVYLREVAQNAPLNADEEAALVEAMMQGRQASEGPAGVEGQDAGKGAGQQEQVPGGQVESGAQAQERLVSGSMSHALSIALWYRGQGLSLLDLVREGQAGLEMAARTYVPGNGYTFSAYAAWCAERAMVRAVRERRRMVRMPAGVVEMVAQLHRAAHKLLRQSLREPTVGELARELDTTPEQVRRVLDFARALKALSGSVESGRYDPTAFGVLVPPEEQAERQALVEQVHNLLPNLSQEERQIAAKFYGLRDGRMRTIAQVANELGISRGLVSQVIARLHRELNP